MTEIHRTLTVMEGREENSIMVEDLASAARQRGWGFCQLSSINSDLIARYDFDSIPLDFVIFRELSNNNYHEVERVMYWLKANHKICINCDIAGRRISTSDKHFQQGLFLLDPFLKQYALPTFEAKHYNNVLSYIDGDRVHYPILLKERNGTAGENITLINNQSDLEKVQDFSSSLIEQYIHPECDFRVFVVGGVATTIVHKVGDTNDYSDFESWSGGRQRNLEQNPTLRDRLSEIATRAAAVSKLEYAGIDILKEADSDNLYLLETNIAAGWQNLSKVIPPVEIPLQIIDWLEEISIGRSLPIETAVTRYLSNHIQFLPSRIQSSINQIKQGNPEAIEPYYKIFDNYPQDYLYDAGYIFKQLSDAYLDTVNHPDNASNYHHLIEQIGSLPLSWAGNFIGPKVGTFHDGAILSVIYLFLLHKIREI